MIRVMIITLMRQSVIIFIFILTMVGLKSSTLPFQLWPCCAARFAVAHCTITDSPTFFSSSSPSTSSSLIRSTYLLYTCIYCVPSDCWPIITCSARALFPPSLSNVHRYKVNRSSIKRAARRPNQVLDTILYSVHVVLCMRWWSVIM